MRVEDYERVIAVWQESVAACERHLKMAAQLQKDGLEMMVRGKKDDDAKLARSGRQTMAEGVRMEQATNRELLALQRNKPRK